MLNKALVIIDIQNDITKNYKDIIGNINAAIDWAVSRGIHVVYIRNEFLTPHARKFIPGTFGAELATDLNVVSENVFLKYKSNALTSEAFADFISKNGIDEFYIAGADATCCVKSTVFNMRKADYKVTVLSDCVTSFDKRKIDEMLAYYESKGGKVVPLNVLMS